MLKWVFGADTGPFRGSLNEMRTQVKSFSGSVTGQMAGIFGGGALVAGAAAIIEKFARLKDLADRFGESAESMQRVGYAAGQSGTDLEGVAKAMTKVTANAVKAARDGGELAASFVRLGIDAAAFANLPIEDKLLALSAGYDGAKSSAQGLTDIIGVMGKSGSEMIPLLVQGSAALQAQLQGAQVAGDGMVGVLADLDDRIQGLKNGFTVLFANIIGGFTAVTATVGLMIGGIYDAIAGGFDMSEIDKARGAIDQLWKDVFDPEKKAKPKGPDVEGIKEAAEAAKKSAEERIKLTEEIAKLEEDARIKSLSLAEQILDVQKRIAELAKESTTGTDENKKLEAKKAMLEAEKELVGYRGKAAEDAKKLAEQKDKLDTDLDKAHDKEDKQNRDNKYSGMDDNGKVDMLKKERDQARKDADNLGRRGFHVEATEKRTEAASKQGEIDNLTRSMNSELQKQLADAQKAVPSIATSSLADIGGGGGARLMDNDQQRRMVDLLAQIATNTAGGSGGSKPPDPI